MDERRARRPPPERMGELPPHVRVFLNSLTQEDIQYFWEWKDFAAWKRRSWRYSKYALWLAFALFGASVSIAQGLDWLSKWWKGTP